MVKHFRRALKSIHASLRLAGLSPSGRFLPTHLLPTPYSPVQLVQVLIPFLTDAVDARLAERDLSRYGRTDDGRTAHEHEVDDA